MNTEHRYIYEKGSKKHRCPNCDKKRFVRYVDTTSGNYIPETYGRCDREVNCGYHLNPYQDGYAKAVWEQEQGNSNDWKLTIPKPKKKPIYKPKIVFIPDEVLKQTRAGYERNVFIQNLLTRVAFPCDVQDIEKVISMYHLGTVQNGYRSGAITLPFIDKENNVRAIQVKEFDQLNHTTGTDFLHSIIEKHHTRNNIPLPEWLEAYNKNETKVSCLFGEHLLSKYPYNPVALVEAPKTAIYGTLYFGFPEQPENLLWLAVYNLSSLNLSKCKSLEGRNVFLFPDLSKDGKAFDLWSNKANDIQIQLKGTYFQVSDLLERFAPLEDRKAGKDLADFLIKQDWRLFRNKEIPQPEPLIIETSVKSVKCVAQKKTFLQPPTLNDYDGVFDFPFLESIDIDPADNWNTDIEELESFFENIELPTYPIKVNEWSTISNCNQFIESHFATVKANNGKHIFLPHLNRLKELKKLLINQNKSN